MKRLTLRVGGSDGGARLDRFVASAGGISRSLARRVLDAGGVFLDGRRCKVASRVLREGQSVAVHLEESGRTASGAPAALERRAILFADAHLVAVDKPAFVPSQPTLTTDRGALPELVAAVLRSPVLLVHRLDRETSGVCVLARSPAAAATLSAAFRDGSPEKTYLALTTRTPTPPEGRIDAPLGPDPSRPGRRTVRPGAEPAATRYRTALVGRGGAALVECHPETGRTHQIRAHLAHLGAPLLGDSRYGGARRFLDIPVPRVMLHAARLSLAHPATGATMTFEAPVPDDYRAVREALSL